MDFFEREFPEIVVARATAVVMIKRIQSRLWESAERHEDRAWRWTKGGREGGMMGAGRDDGEGLVLRSIKF